MSTDDGKWEYPRYGRSFLWPVAPEYATGEVLLGGVYRHLILNWPDKNVDLQGIDLLPARLADKDPSVPRAVWEQLLFSNHGLSSPAKSGQTRTGRLKQLMPFVPEIARYACVIGGKRNRWRPGRLLDAVLFSGLSETDAKALRESIEDHLRVGTEGDDVFAEFMDQALPKTAAQDDDEEKIGASHGAWRKRARLPLTPSERFCDDIKAILDLKKQLTRRQWIDLIEAILRVGLPLHTLWLCRLNDVIWTFVNRAINGDALTGPESVEVDAWLGHHSVRPLLEIGQPTGAMIKRELESYAIARIGLNLLLQSLARIGNEWDPRKECLPSPAEAIAALLKRIQASAVPIKECWQKEFGTTEATRIVGLLAEKDPKLLASESGYTNNINEFLTYALGQISPTDGQRWSYDQSYLSAKGRGVGKRQGKWKVQLGASTLVALVYCCCRANPKGTASIEDLKAHLQSYGIGMTAGELQTGDTGRDLEVLGLVVDSPDAGGGRLLVNPF